MRYVFLLLLSEFFRHLCLCLIPSLHASGDKIHIVWIFDFLLSLKDKCSNLRISLKSVFDFYYVYERSHQANQPPKVNVEWLHKGAYLKLCSVSLSLQNVLRRSRNLEETLENLRSQESKHDDVVNILDLKSNEIRKSYDLCKPIIDDFCRYVANLKPKSTQQNKVTTPIVPVSVDKTRVLLGVSDFSPQWPDEVFVAISEEKTTDVWVADSEDVVCNQAPKLLLNELKLALRDKAKEWKERERIALKNKNMDEDFEENSGNDTTDLSDSESETSSSARSIFIEPRNPLLTTNFNSESSFAKQIAAASASWGLQSEEFFDKSDDEESSTSN